jgi:hypothetical protein
MKRYNQGFWSVYFPDMWIVQDDDFPITFLEEDADWAIQLSHYLKESAAVTDTDLEEYISDMGKPGCLKKEIVTPNARGLQVEFTDEDNTLLRHTVLRSGHIMVYVTYNVNTHGRQLDGLSFQRFIESIQIRGEQLAAPDRR